VGDLVFVATGNGIDDEEKLVSPKAPSFLALDKRTGRLVWQTALPNVNTIQAHFSSPAFTDHGGRRQVIFAGGDGVIYSFVPETGELLWKCDCLPVRGAKNDKESDNQFVGSPVIVGDKLYIGMGLAPDSPRAARSSYFLCLDITKKGDVSLRSYKAKSPENKDAALIWAFGGPTDPEPERGPRVDFGPTVSTAAVHQGLIYIAESQGYLHCLDAATGSRIWVYDLAVQLHGSPYIANGQVYVGSEDGDIVLFNHMRAARIRATIDMEEYVRTTPVAANGVLYIATQSKLYAIAAP
jgi:outer membrane protein assembly factor BamB